MGPTRRPRADPKGRVSVRRRRILAPRLEGGLLWHATGPMELASSAWYKIAASEKGRPEGRDAAEQPVAADEVGAMAGCEGAAFAAEPGVLRTQRAEIGA